jgi:hypothetical protein
VFYLDALGTLSPCTVTDNGEWRRATAGMTVSEAITHYRATLDEPPHSSCSAHLAAIRAARALAAG